MVDIRNGASHKQLASTGDLIGVRYRVVRWLGAGAQGQTYEVEDSIRGGRYALKLIRLETSNLEAIANLKREFRTLVALQHPGILKVHDFGVASWGGGRDGAAGAECGWFYTADLIEGRDLFSATGEATIEQLIALSLQAATALACMHARGILHRDLKPDNMLLDNRGCLRLIDFGLSLAADSPPVVDGAGDADAAGGTDADAGDAGAATRSLAAAGTPDYLPPEIALGERADARSDLYSLGAVLYQIATRQLPFPGETAAQVIRRQLRDVPESPDRLRADLPPALASIIMRLLEKAPDARFQTADALFAALQDLLGDTSIDGAAGQALAAATRPENRLRTGVLFGREAERAELREQLQQILDRQQTSARGGRFVVVSGESGVGKSALIDDFLREAALDDLPVIAGSYGMGGARVLQGVAEIVQQAARLTSEARREEHRWLIDRLSAHEEGPTAGGGLSADNERLRLAHAVTAFLQAVAEERPLVVCIENLDQADATTIEVVSYLLRNPGPSPLLCLAELRGSGERAELRELMAAVEHHAHARHVALTPLAPPEVSQFAAFLLVDGEAPAELLDWLAANTGMPYLIIEMLRFLLRRGHLELEGQTFVCPDGVPEAMLREGVQALVGEKYVDVSREAREVLHVVAAALGPVDVLTVRAALRAVEPELSAGMDGASDAAVVLEDLVHNRLLMAAAAEYRENGAAGASEGHCYTFASSLEKTVVYDAIPPAERCGIHAALATEMERGGGEQPDVETLAHHYTRAEMAEPGYRFAVLAARKAAGLFCDDGACQWYEAALQCAEQDDERCAVLEQLAATCQRSGQLDQGLDYLRTALRLGGEVPTGQRSRLLERVGQLQVEKGELDAAMEVYADALETLGQVSDANPAARVTILANMGWVHLYHGDLEAARNRSEAAFRFLDETGVEGLNVEEPDVEELNVDRPNVEEPNVNETETVPEDALPSSWVELVAARRQVLMCQAAIELSEQKFADAASIYEEALRISRRLGNPHDEATALSNLGVTSSLCGDIRTAMRRWQESLKIRRRVQHFRGIADCENNIGIGHYEHGRPAASLQAYGDALAIHRRIGGRLGEAMASLNIGEACLDLGWLRSAYQLTLRALQGYLTAGEEDGIQRGIMQLGLVLARLSASEALAALVEQAERRYGAESTAGAAQQALQQATPPRLQGLLSMIRGEAAEAVRRLADVQGLLAESGESRLCVDNQLDLIAAATAAGDSERARIALEAARAEEAVERSPLLRTRLELADLALQRAVPDDARSAEHLETWFERLDTLVAVGAEEGTECLLLATVTERFRGQLYGTSRPAEATSALQRAKEAGEAVLVADLEFADSVQTAASEAYPPEMRDLLLTDGEVDAGVANHLRLADLDRERQAARLALSEHRQHGVGGDGAAGDGVGVMPSSMSDAHWRLLTWIAELEGTTDLAQLWESIRAELATWIGARRVLIACGAGEAPLEAVAGAGAGLSASMTGKIITTLDEALVAQVGHRMLVRGEPCDEVPTLPDLCADDVTSVLVLTFHTDETTAPLRGAIYADTVNTIPAPSAVDDHLLHLLGRAVGRAATAARRLARVNRRLEQITQLYQLSAVPARSVNPDQVLTLSMASMIKLTGAERGFIFLDEAGDIECRVATDQEGKPIKDAVGEVSWSILTDVLQTNEAVRVDDALSDRQLSSQSSIVDLQLRSVMCVPIRSGQKTLGMAYVDNRTRTGNFSADDLRIFGMFGDQIAAALDKAYHFVQLQEANRLKSEFLTNVSHELLTPLNGIIGFAQLLGDEELTADGREGLGYLDQSAKHLQSIVEGLLTLSSIEAGSFKPEPVDFDLEVLMSEFNLELTCLCGARELGADVVVEEDVPRHLRGDAKLIKQILEHLVDNAIKFTEQGLVRIRVCLHATPGSREGKKPQAELRFEVEDTGIGVPEAAKDLIFSPFTQADGSLTRHHGGTGLGLTICQRVARLLGGEMGLKSEVGQGSTFWFTARLGRAGEPSTTRQ